MYRNIYEIYYVKVMIYTMCYKLPGGVCLERSYLYTIFCKIICPRNGLISIKQCKIFIFELWKVHQSGNEGALTWGRRCTNMGTKGHRYLGAKMFVAKMNNNTEVNNLTKLLALR